VPVKKPSLLVKTVVYRMVKIAQNNRVGFHQNSLFHIKPAIAERVNMTARMPPIMLMDLTSPASAWI